tara:strand:+ start:536 stop:703 length:168 start_codon:yes stop_codon:yes gene_type:complete
MKEKTKYKSILLKEEDFNTLQTICDHERDKEQPGIVSPGRMVTFLVKKEAKERNI